MTRESRTFFVMTRISMSAKGNKKKNNGSLAGLDWVHVSQRPPAPNGKSATISVVDLFCSCGAMTLGVWEGARQHKRRLDIRLAIDIAEDPLAIYRANFEDDTRRVRGDDVARVFDGRRGQPSTAVERHWKGRVKNLDLIVAGPPCQGHSDLNNSTRREDPRNRLYLRVARAAEVLRPRVVILENVPQVLLDRGSVVKQAVNWLQALDYDVAEQVIRLGRFGVPQLRKRHILTAVRDGEFDLADLDDIAESPPTAGTFLSGLENESDTDGLFHRASRVNKTNSKRIGELREA